MKKNPKFSVALKELRLTVTTQFECVVLTAKVFFNNVSLFF